MAASLGMTLAYDVRLKFSYLSTSLSIPGVKCVEMGQLAELGVVYDARLTDGQVPCVVVVGQFQKEPASCLVWLRDQHRHVFFADKLTDVFCDCVSMPDSESRTAPPEAVVGEVSLLDLAAERSTYKKWFIGHLTGTKKLAMIVLRDRAAAEANRKWQKIAVDGSRLCLPSVFIDILERGAKSKTIPSLSTNALRRIDTAALMSKHRLVCTAYMTEDGDSQAVAVLCMPAIHWVPWNEEPLPPVTDEGVRVATVKGWTEPCAGYGIKRRDVIFPGLAVGAEDENAPFGTIGCMLNAPIDLEGNTGRYILTCAHVFCKDPRDPETAYPDGTEVYHTTLSALQHQSEELRAVHIMQAESHEGHQCDRQRVMASGQMTQQVLEQLNEVQSAEFRTLQERQAVELEEVRQQKQIKPRLIGHLVGHTYNPMFGDVAVIQLAPGVLVRHGFAADRNFTYRAAGQEIVIDAPASIFHLYLNEGGNLAVMKHSSSGSETKKSPFVVEASAIEKANCCVVTHGLGAVAEEPLALYCWKKLQCVHAVGMVHQAAGEFDEGNSGALLWTTNLHGICDNELVFDDEVRNGPLVVPVGMGWGRELAAPIAYILPMERVLKAAIFILLQHLSMLPHERPASGDGSDPKRQKL